MKKMENVVFTVEYIEDEACVFAVQFVGVMDEDFIYAKRCSLISGNPDDPTYVKVAIGDTTDTTAHWVSDWKCPFRNLQVPESIGLKDQRLELEPELSEEIYVAINAAYREKMGK